MATTRVELRLLEGLVVFALAVVAIGTVLSIPGPFVFGGERGTLITWHRETVTVPLTDQCDLRMPPAPTDIALTKVCSVQAAIGEVGAWSAPVREPLFAAARLGAPLLALAVLWLLLKIVRSVGDGDPFVVANARRMQIMGFVIAIGGVVIEAIRTAAEINALDRVERMVPGLMTEWAFEMSFLPVAAGILLIGLAEVFRQGARLRADVEGLV